MTAVKTLWKVLFGSFCFLVLVGLLVGDKDASSTITTETPHLSSTQNATPAPAAQASTALEPAKGTTPRTTLTTTRNSREQAISVTRWGTNTLPITNTITEDLRTVSDAATSMDIARMVQGCRALKRSVGRLRNELPAPDSELDAALSAAVYDFTEAADHCIRGGTSLDLDEIQQATKHMTAGGRHISRATERTEELGRQIRGE